MKKNANVSINYEPLCVLQQEFQTDINDTANLSLNKDDKRRPLRMFRSGTLNATIWHKEETTERRSSYSIVIEKRIKLENQDWKSVRSLKLGDLPHLIAVAKEAYLFLEELLKPRGLEEPLVVKEWIPER